MTESLIKASASQSLEDIIREHYADCEPIAVIGYACRLSDVPDSKAFWEMLISERDDSASECGQIDHEFNPDDLGAPGKRFVPLHRRIVDVDAFDANLFGYPPQEAELIDPQQRLFLESVWHAIEHGGYAPRHVPFQTGIFGATRVSTYPGQCKIDPAKAGQVQNLQSLMGNDKDYLTSRVAYKLNLSGPAITVQTACSSSLVAVHMACESLRSGACDMAVAGGVAISFPQPGGYEHQPGMIFSSDGKCRPFDRDADGTFPGHGVASVTLRRLNDALRDGDPITAVIRGDAVNNDGALKAGFTAPSVQGQKRVIKEALALAGLRPRDISMIEAHGTATPLGDSIEVQALREVFYDRLKARRPCAIGSVKGNVGHLDTAAGIVSFLKAVMSVEHAIIPRSAYCKHPNTDLQLDESPFFIPTESIPWMSAQRYAGVSSFGIGGTNCHIIVGSLPNDLRMFQSQYPSRRLPSDMSADKPVLLLSAASEPALRRLAGSYAEALDHENPSNLAYTALTARQIDLNHRLAVALDQKGGEALRAFSQGARPVHLDYDSRQGGNIAFLCTGQGADWPSRARDYYNVSPEFAATLDLCSAHCDAVLPVSLRNVLLGGDDACLKKMRYVQPAIVAFNIAMAAHWHALGLRPDLVIGHSIGEYAAAVISGMVDLEDVMPLICHLGALMDETECGGMISLNVKEEEARALADRHGLDVAAVNSASQTVLSGAIKSTDDLATYLKRERLEFHRLSVSGAAHSRLMDPILPQYDSQAGELKARDGNIRLISTYLDDVATPDDLNQIGFWGRHLRATIRFRDAIDKAVQMGTRIFLEIGPDAILTRCGQNDHPHPYRWVASAQRSIMAEQKLLEANQSLFTAGVPLEWQNIFAIEGRRIHAPLYSFDRTPYWRDAADSARHVWDDHARLRSGLDQGRHVALENASSLNLNRLKTLYDCARALHAIYLDQVILHCLNAQNDVDFTISEVLRGGRLLPRYRQLLSRMLSACVEDGYYHKTSHGFRRTQPDIIPHGSRLALLEKLARCCEGLDAIPTTVERAGARLFDMLRGHVTPVEIIFPEGESRGVEVLYQDFSFGRYFNEIAAGILSGMLRHQRRQSRDDKPLRILEVGGGTGGTTSSMVAAVGGEDEVLYHFTDISPVFTRRAQDKFSAHAFMRYGLLDLHKDPVAQGFEGGVYDLIIAANVVHATEHVGQTLTRLRSLLRPGGHLLLREITRPMRLFDFVFGPLVSPLLDVENREGQLFLSKDLWRKHCREAGFARIDWLPDDDAPVAEMGEHIILATCPTGISSAATGLPADHNPLLDVPLTSDGFYLANWSACSGNASLWNQKLIETARLLNHRHGGEDNIEIKRYPMPSHPIARVRLAWRASPLCQGRLAIEAEDPFGIWNAILPGNVTKLLPMSKPSISTQYEVAWVEMPPVTGATPFPFDDVLRLKSVLRRGGGTVRLQTRMTIHVCHVEEAEPSSILGFLKAHFASPEMGPLVIVTRNAWLFGKDVPVSPISRAIWGLIKVAAQEYPGHQVKAIDLDASASVEDLITGLESLDNGAHFVSVREAVARRQCITHLTSISQPLPPDSFEFSGWHIVTGGFGGLGRLSVAWLAAHGAKFIAILAPHMHQDGQDFFDAIRASYDTTLRWIDCDVSDHQQVNDALDTLLAEGGVAGAIHAAGLIEDAPIENMDEATLLRVFAVKAEASRTLRSWLNTHRGRYLLLFSSAAATMGSAGQAAHAAACGYLDGLAEAQCPNAVLKVLAIAWGAWSGLGKADDDALSARLAAHGMGQISPEEGIWHLEQAVMRSRRYRIAMRLNPDALNDVHRNLIVPDATTMPKSAPIKQDEERVPFFSQNEVRDWLTGVIATLLHLTEIATIKPDKTLVELGVDSLLLLELRSIIEKQSHICPDARFLDTNQTIDAIARAIFTQRTLKTPVAAKIQLEHDAVHRFSPFPLTPIQHAYWVGRTEIIDYGGIACHILFEWDLDRRQIDPDRFIEAWNVLIKRHDMLRVVIAPDGQQCVLKTVPSYTPALRDLTELSLDAREENLLAFREELASRILPTDHWPLFEIAISHCDVHSFRLHMHLDLLLFDVRSLKIMMDDLAAAYRGAHLDDLTFTFRDYVVAEESRRKNTAWQTAWRFWCGQLHDLPPAPKLPICSQTNASKPKLITRKGSIDAASWQALKSQWRSWGVTPSVGLLTIFARTLDLWARQPTFTINLTMFDRQAVHDQIDQVIGDFTSVLLIAFDLRERISLRDHMIRAQKTLQKALQNKEVNGVELMRELAKIHGHSRTPQMPIVFTSMLGMTLDGLNIDQAMQSFLGEPSHVFTQTPQVWLDHQVMEIEGALIFNWYCMDDVLAEDFSENAFSTYNDILRGLTKRPDLMKDATLEALSQDDRWYDPLARQRDGEDATTRSCRIIEREMRALPGIAHAQAEFAHPNKCVIDFVTHHDSDSSVTPRGFPNALPLTLRPSLPANLCAETDQAWAIIEDRALNAMITTLQDVGLFLEAHEHHLLDEVKTALNSATRHDRLVEQWLEKLTSSGYLARDDAGYTLMQGANNNWQVTSMENLKPWVTQLLSYLTRCAELHRKLFSGAENPLSLFFDEEFGFTDLIYASNPVSHHLNETARYITRHFAKQSESAISVLEIGAGTGATTRAVLPAIAQQTKQYVFSDVSTHFLQEAKQIFADHPFMEYQILDINLPIDDTQHPPEGYDLIIAVNVLHDATHVSRSLQRVGKLLRRNGVILIIEATEPNSALQLATIGFIEGLNGYQDFRHQTHEAFLRVSHWRELLKQSGFEVSLVYPEQDNSPLRQHLILATAAHIYRPNLSAIEQALRARHEGNLPLLDLRHREALHSTSQTQLLSNKSSAFIRHVTPSNSAVSKTENIVSNVWEDFLGRHISPESDFFNSGGDSLIATRMVAHLARAGFKNVSLQKLFASPRLRPFCASITPPSDHVGHEWITLAQKDTAQKIFVFHASDGGIAAYLPLAQHLEATTFGLELTTLGSVETLDDLAMRYTESLIASSVEDHYTLLGWSYGAFLAQSSAKILSQRGKSVDLILIEPVLGADFCAVEREDLDAMLTARADLPTERNPISDERVQQTLRLLHMLRGHNINFQAPRRCMCLRAATHPERWGDPAQDWTPYFEQAENNVLPTDHWSLLLDEKWAIQVARRINDWLEEMKS